MIKQPDTSDLSQLKILVTGASGFIGTHLCKALNSTGCEVHGISRSIRTDDNNGVKWWQADIINMHEVKNIFATIKPDVIYHLASLVTGSRDLDFVIPIFNSNLKSTLNLLNMSAEIGCKRFIMVGSMEEPVSSQPEAVPCSPYAAAKWACNAYGRMFHALYQLPVVMLRIFMVYGEGQHDLNKLIPYVILCFLRGEVPQLSSGTRQIDCIHIDDVVNALVSAACADNVEGKTVDIGSGKLLSIKSIVERLIDMINPKITPHYGAVPDRQLEQSRVADIAYSYEVLGWKPSISMQEGLMRTLRWYKLKVSDGTI